MTATGRKSAAVLAVALATIGGLLALAREVMRYRATGGVDWGHVALALGVPALVWVVVGGSANRRRR